MFPTVKLLTLKVPKSKVHVMFNQAAASVGFLLAFLWIASEISGIFRDASDARVGGGTLRRLHCSRGTLRAM